MITKHEEFVLSVALTNERIASEIVVRIIPHTPEDPFEALQFLDIIDTSPKEEKEIKEQLIMSLANKNHAEELSLKLNLIVRCIELQALNLKSNNDKLKTIQNQILPLSDKTKDSLLALITDKEVSKEIIKKIDNAGVFAKNIPQAI